MPEIPQQFGPIAFGVPALFLSLLPLWSNFDGCNQAATGSAIIMAPT